MSKQAIAWAESIKIGNGPMRQVLDKLAYLHHDKQGLYPSQAYLAEKTGLSERGVRYALQLLSHFGIIKRTPRSNGAKGRTSDLVILSFGLHDISREQVSAAKRALRKPLSNRHRVPVATPNSQPAPRAGGPGTACQGIGDLTDHLSQVGTVLSVGHYVKDEPADPPGLRLVKGGRA